MTLRGKLTKRPEGWLTGELVSAKKLNQMADGLARLDTGVATAEVPLIQRPLLQVFQLKINFILGDYLQGREYRVYDDDSTFEGTVDISVARPWLLRRTPFDGVTYNGVTYTYVDEQTRNAVSGPDSEVQRITPDYVLGDIIYCCREVLGGTGVSVSLRALDMNVDGRCWAAEDLAA